jgi:hypothetical protein
MDSLFYRGVRFFYFKCHDVWHFFFLGHVVHALISLVHSAHMGEVS